MSESRPRYYIEPEWKKHSKEVWNKTKGKCWYCGTDTQPFDRKKFSTLEEGDYRERVRIPHDTFVIDHVIPLSLAGGNNIINLVPCCWACNGAKKDKSLEEFRFLRSRELAGMPRFNDEQIAYLLLHGINLPPIQRYEFYFEISGLSDGEL